MFVDEVDVHVTAGHGGRGCLAFRREKFVPRGGPSGGDGGHGGSIYLTADPQLNTLLNFRFHPEFHAERGAHGQGSNRTGHDGSDLELRVPVGTQIFERGIDGELHLVADLTHAGERVLVARGGRGGLGNARFATATNRAPRHTQPGEAGEEKHLRLQLKLLADVGLVGFPNAGKSTLISRISAAKPKIADYPFTTLVPNLGVVGLSGDRTFVVADVPGLIEGAHRGLGLGHQFLRHLERTQVLVHVIDVSEGSGRDPVDDFETVRRELTLFCQDLAAKPQLAAANKMDALDDPGRLDALRARLEPERIPLFPISAATGAGIPALLEAMWPHVAAARQAQAVVVSEDEPAPARRPLPETDDRYPQAAADGPAGPSRRSAPREGGRRLDSTGRPRQNAARPAAVKARATRSRAAAKKRSRH